MKERPMNPEEEMIAAYGEDFGVIPEDSQVESTSLAGSSYEQEKVSDLEVFGEEQLSSLEHNERMAAEAIVASVGRISERLSAESLLERQKSAEALLGSAFAAAPTSHREEQELPLWKRIVSGATKGASRAAKAVALTVAVGAPGAAQEIPHPNPIIQKKVDYLFGTSIVERFGTQRASFKKDYTMLEERKQFLQDQVSGLKDPTPRTREEAIYAQSVEADRDAKLAAYAVERTLETQAFNTLHTNDPVERARFDASIAAIAAKEAKAILDCENQLIAQHSNSLTPRELEDIYREIMSIERKENELLLRFSEMHRDNFGWGGGYGGGYSGGYSNYTSWN